MSMRYKRPRSCLRRDGKPKISYPDITSAQTAADDCTRKYGQQFSAYPCSECPHHHIGNTSAKIRQGDKTRVEWIELGDRAAHHLFAGDTRPAINKRYRTAERLTKKC